MKTLSSSKTLIIGAGGGGISSALLASHRGEDVTLVEAHSALGGCASYFRRGQFVFDAGATTLSGVGVGEPVGELFELLGSSPSLWKCDPGITFHLSDGKIISYHKDFEEWMRELSTHFPQLEHRKFWTIVREINKKSWSLLKDIRTFPFVQFSDLTDVLKNPHYISLVPYLLISTEMALKKFGLFEPSYLELVNGIMIISAQAESREIPFLVGAMALSYPAETYAPVGGMKGLMDFFEKELIKRNVKILKKSKVNKIGVSSIDLSSGEEIYFDKLISNVPIWNMANMTDGDLKQKLKNESEHRPGSWGALTLYFGSKSEINSCYHQVHLNHPKVKNYFVSFSVPEDKLRAPEGYQSVSISTHVYAENFTEYDKELISELIMEDFSKRFSVSEIKHFNVGTPKTFERYTHRKNGFVGGLPFLYGKNPMSLLSPVINESEIYRVGDTVFPGQGLCGVIAGSLQLHHRLRK